MCFNKKIDIDHPQGIGNLIQSKCDVLWDIIIPDDFVLTPYYVIISFGTHSHVPPPPHIPQLDNVQSLENVLRPILTPGLTRSKFIIITCLKRV